jgi:hypothetical protein
MTTPKLLFILKRREDYDSEKHNKLGLSTGLFNSSLFIVDMLKNNGIDAIMEVVVDNNEIDRVVTLHRPTHVIIEALWVVPTKFSILKKLHPKVKWIIRLHSETPFLAGEGMAFDWLGDYSTQDNVYIGVNSPRMLDEIKTFIRIKNNSNCEEKIIFLPNYYPQEYKEKDYITNKDYIDIGCFGALRPMKNHMIQALSSIQFAESIGKKLRFHINAGRIEMNGEPVASNLRSLFQHIYNKGHLLISNVWSPRESFLKLCSQMDIGLQVSFSETFNIVGADIISQGVPLIGSNEIPWMDKTYSADPVNSKEIVDALLRTHSNPIDNIKNNKNGLINYTNHSQKTWLQYINGEK